MKFFCPTREAVEWIMRKENKEQNELDENDWRMARAYSMAKRLEDGILLDRQTHRTKTISTEESLRIQERMSPFAPPRAIQIRVNALPDRCAAITGNGDKCGARVRCGNYTCGRHGLLKYPPPPHEQKPRRA